MPDIFQDFSIKAAAPKVFEAVSTPGGLDRWWTKKSKGEPRGGAGMNSRSGPHSTGAPRSENASKTEHSNVNSPAQTPTGSQQGLVFNWKKKGEPPPRISTTLAGQPRTITGASLATVGPCT